MMETTIVKVGGMSCSGCVKSVTGVLEALPGVGKAEISLDNGEARVEFDAAQVSRDALVGAIADAGFDAS